MDLSSTCKLNDGNKIPVMGFGTYRLASGKEAEAAALHALRTGYRLIDTASYYRNEEDVGRAIRASGIAREEIFATTKIWNDQHGDPLAAFGESRRRLGLDYVDLYLIHWPVPERRETWKALCSMQDTGKIRSIGVANFTVRHLEDFLSSTDTVPAVNQVEFTPFLYQKDLLQYCKKKGILVEAYAPLTRGAKFQHPAISDIAAKRSRTPAQILLRWCIQHGVVPIPKSHTPARIDENARVFGFSLTASDMKKLDGLNEDYRVAPDPTDMP